MIAPAAAPPIRATLVSAPASDSCATRKKHPAPAALNKALNRLVRKAYSPTGKIIPQT